MGNRRMLTGLLILIFLGVVPPGSKGFFPSGVEPAFVPDTGQAPTRTPRALTQLVSTRVRGLGFDVGPIRREEPIYLVPVTGFRAERKAFRLVGPFRPFTLKAAVDGRQVVLDKGDLDAAGFVVADPGALRDLGVRVEPVGTAAPGTPAARPTAKVRPPAATGAGNEKPQAAAVGPRRLPTVGWSPLAMAPPRAARKNPPPPLGQAAAIRRAEERIDFKASLFKVNKRAPLAHAEIPILDPGKSAPTPLADPKQALPPFENGRSLTAEDYFRELNLLEKDFNALGYSLDSRRDGADEVVLQEIAPPAGQNGTRVRMDAAGLARVRSQRGGFQSALSAKRTRLAALTKPPAKAIEKTPAAAPTKVTARQAQEATRSKLQKAGPPSLEEALRDAKAVMKPPPNPYKKELNPVIVEKGDRDTFAIGLNASSLQNGSTEALRVVNGVGVHAYVFGHGLDLVSVQGTTSAPAAGGEMYAGLSLLVLGNQIASAGFSRTVPVPSTSLAETAALSPVGEVNDWSTSVDVGYGMSFMAGPIPLSVRVGARATVGLAYTLLASPVRVENEIMPYANADIYAQAGVDLLIVEAGIKCDLNLLDTSLAVHGMLQRGAEDGREFLDIEYFVHRWFSALSGDLSVYANVYVPRWGLPPWKLKKYTSRICGWDGYSDDLWEPALTRRRHSLFIYPGTSAVVAGYTF